MFLRLHAFGHDAQMKDFSQSDDGFDDFEVVGVFEHGLDKRAVDLEDVDGQALQIRQGRVARSEIVHGDLKAHFLQPLQL